MRPWLFAGAIVVALGLTLTAIAHTPRNLFVDAPPPVADMASPFVKVERERGHGSGVHIGSGYFITASHVTGGASEVILRTSQGDTQKGTVLWENKQYDIALVLAKHPERFAAAELSCRTASVGEDIRTEGNPLDIGAVTTWGRIAGGQRKAHNWSEILVTDATTVMGQSGGAVLDKDNRVIGIVVGVYAAPMGFGSSLTGYGIVVPGSVVCRLLGRAA